MLDDNTKQAILKFLKTEHADPQEQQKLLSSIQEFSTELTIDFIENNLTAEDLKIFICFSNQDQSGVKAIKFAKEKIPDFDQKLAGIIKKEIDRINS